MMTSKERTWRNTEFGQFKNDGRFSPPIGYRADRFDIIDGVAQYHFTLDNVNPLTYVLGTRPAAVLNVPVGTEVQPCKAYDTDWGSVGHAAAFYREDRFISWLFHDSAYEFRYVWIRKPGEGLWGKLPVTRWQADKCFCEHGLGAEDADAWDRAVVFNAVHLFGGSVWARHDAKFAAS